MAYHAHFLHTHPVLDPVRGSGMRTWRRTRSLEKETFWLGYCTYFWHLRRIRPRQGPWQYLPGGQPRGPLPHCQCFHSLDRLDTLVSTLCLMVSSGLNTPGERGYPRPGERAWVPGAEEVPVARPPDFDRKEPLHAPHFIAVWIE